MTKIDIISGFLGAGKTTLIKKLLDENLKGEKLVIIENEFGEVGIDGTLLKGSAVEVKEMNSGCICCTIAGDFTASLKEVLKLYHPDRVIIEPSGVGKLSDVKKACQPFVVKGEVELNISIAVVDALRFKMYLRNFNEFFKDQIVAANTIVLSRTQKMDSEKISEVVEALKILNPSANLITTHWEALNGEDFYSTQKSRHQILFEKEVLREVKKVKQVQQCTHKNCNCNHGHSADQVFQVWGVETSKVFSTQQIEELLDHLDTDKTFGTILRAKGIVEVNNSQWLQFDYVAFEKDLKPIAAEHMGKLCVIGQNINKERLNQLFGV